MLQPHTWLMSLCIFHIIIVCYHSFIPVSARLAFKQDFDPHFDEFID